MHTEQTGTTHGAGLSPFHTNNTSKQRVETGNKSNDRATSIYSKQVSRGMTAAQKSTVTVRRDYSDFETEMFSTVILSLKRFAKTTADVVQRR